MSLWSKIRGTIESIFQLGLSGPQLKNNSGAIEARDNADAAFVVVRGLAPVAANDFVTLATWVAVAAGTTQAAAANTWYVADATGARVTFNLPSAPADGSFIVIKLTGSPVAIPVLVNAGAGDTAENPNSPGTFTAVAGQVSITAPGTIYAIKYQASNTRWIEYI